MADTDDIQAPDPVHGLPEVPPEGERILWQGSPDWWRLANEALSLRLVAAFFGFLAGWAMLVAWADGQIETGLASAAWLLGMGAIACGFIAFFAWVMARATVYTVTNRRIVLKIGVALTMAINIPYKWVAKADLDLRRGGSGTIALDLLGDNQFSYLVLWPHARPWHMKRSQPALRSIRNAEWVARLIAQQAQAAVTVDAEGNDRAAAPANPQIAAE